MECNYPQIIEFLEPREAFSKLRKDIKNGIPIFGIDPDRSNLFDDFIYKSAAHLNELTLKNPKSELQLIKTLHEVMIEERNKNLLQKVISEPSNESNVHESKSFKIEKDYSFEDVPATKDCLSILEQARLDYENPSHKELPAVIKFGGVPVGSLGNFSMIIGKPKSKKTFLTTLIASSALSEGDESGFISVSLPEDKSQVIFFDTEQSAAHLCKVAERVMYMAKDFKRNRFEAFALRPFSIGDRLNALEELFNEFPNIGLVIIDGIKDLVSEINNEKQSTEIAGKLLEWTQRYNIHIVVVLHQNKGDDNARGHLGSELQNKAETTVTISNRKHLSIIKPSSTRNEEFQPFGIELKEVTINNKELVVPQVVNNLKTDTLGRVNKPVMKPESISIEVHRKILEKLATISTEREVNKGMAKSLIKEIAREHKLEFGDSKSQKFLKYYEDKGWVELIKPGGVGRQRIQVNKNSIQ